MPKRYVCRGCSHVDDKKGSCNDCGEKMEKVEFPWTLQAVLPYVFAATAAFVLIVAYLTGRFRLIWLTFPLVIIGLVIDHYYQRKLDIKAKESVKNSMTSIDGDGI